MKKWVGPGLSVFFVLLLVFLSSPFLPAKSSLSESGRIMDYQVTPAQGDKKEDDTEFIQSLKAIQEKLDGWLKSLNERIEREDVTRFEVRFLEILRSILEWIKEKVDGMIESSRAKQQEQKKGGKSFRDTHRQFFPVSGMG